MEFEKCLKERRSVREFKPDKVSRETFEKIIEMSRFAPSWKNSQTPRYHVVCDEAVKNTIADECVLGFEHNNGIIKGAPALLIITAVAKRSGYEKDGSFSTSKEDRWEVFDSGIATQSFCLAAHNEGVGTVIMGIFDDAKVKEKAGIPENENVMALVACGYAAGDNNGASARKEVSELVKFI